LLDLRVRRSADEVRECTGEVIRHLDIFLLAIG
jgi:hypothetical protein